MVSMALLLLPGMPGGGESDDARRAAYIAGHPWLWRLGWLPWQLTAFADLLLAVALRRTAWVPRLPAVLTVAVTVAAIIPDQMGQFLWITRGVELAAGAVTTGDVGPYLAFERPIFRMVGIYGCIGYLLGALGWTWCFAAAGTWSRRLTWLSVAAWGTFAAAVVIYFLPERLSPGAFWVSTGNAVDSRDASSSVAARGVAWSVDGPSVIGRIYRLTRTGAQGFRCGFHRTQQA